MPGEFAIFQQIRLDVLDLVVAFIPVLAVAHELVFVLASIQGHLADPETGLLVLLEHILVDSPVVEGTSNGNGSGQGAVGFEHHGYFLGGLGGRLLGSRGLSGSLLLGALGAAAFLAGAFVVLAVAFAIIISFT